MPGDNGVLRERLRNTKRQMDEGIKSIRATHDAISTLHQDLGSAINELATAQGDHMDVTVELLGHVDELRLKVEALERANGI